MLIKYIIGIILGVAILIGDSGYNTIYLMEFENQENEFTNSHLTEALPNLIKSNYEFRQDIRVEYASDIRPYLEKNDSNIESIRGLIINGRFLTIKDEFFIEFEAYDIQNWKRLIRRQLFCPIDDIICVHDGFLISIEQSISPFLVDAINIDETIDLLDKPLSKKTPPRDIIKETIEGFDDLNNTDLEQLESSNQGQYGDRYYREFNLDDLSNGPNSVNKKNTDKLIDIFDQILTNPYNVVIGDLELTYDDNIKGNIIGNIPIEYSVRSNLAQELLSDLPHKKIMDKNGNVILQFSDNDFIFNKLLLEKSALMKYQLMPVVFFQNRIGAIQFIILDSWDEKYKHLKFDNLFMLMENQFRPLFAITPGANHIQLDLNVTKQQNIYSFSIPSEQIGDYTKVAVKFMKEDELDGILKKQFQQN